MKVRIGDEHQVGCLDREAEAGRRGQFRQDEPALDAIGAREYAQADAARQEVSVVRR